MLHLLKKCRTPYPLFEIFIQYPFFRQKVSDTSLIMKNLYLFLILLLSYPIFAQNHTPSAAGAQGLSMGGTRTSTQGISAIFGNQAGLTALEQTSFIAFGENRFFLADVNQFSVGCGISTASGNFGIALQYFGFEAYNEQKIGLAYARKLFDKLSVGVQLDYLGLRIPDYGNRSNITAEIGLQTQLNPSLCIGIHAFTPFTIAWTDDDFVPTILALGAAWQPSEKVTMTAEIEKDINFPVNAKLGLDYRIVEVLSLRIGVNTYPVQNSFGVGLNLNKLKIDIASVYHQVLGVTTGFSVIYALSEK